MKHIIDYSKKIAKDFSLGGSPIFGWILFLFGIAAGAHLVGSLIGLLWESI